MNIKYISNINEGAHSINDKILILSLTFTITWLKKGKKYEVLKYITISEELIL